jgi:hypothetical protein
MSSEMPILLVWAQVPFDAQPLVWLPCLAFASKQCVIESLLMYDHEGWLDQTELPRGSMIVYQLNNPETWRWHVRRLADIRTWAEPFNSQHVAALKALHDGADTYVDELMKTALECAHSYAAAVPTEAPAAVVSAEVPAATVPEVIPTAAAASSCVHTASTALVQLIQSPCSREHILQNEAALAILPVQANASVPAPTEASASVGEVALVAASPPEAAALATAEAAALTAVNSDQRAKRVCTLSPSDSANASGTLAADSSSCSSSNSSSSCSSSNTSSGSCEVVTAEEELPDLLTLIQQGRLKAKRKAFKIVSPKDHTAVVTLDLTKAGKLSGGNIPAAHVEEMLVSPTNSCLRCLLMSRCMPTLPVLRTHLI